MSNGARPHGGPPPPVPSVDLVNDMIAHLQDVQAWIKKNPAPSNATAANKAATKKTAAQKKKT